MYSRVLSVALAIASAVRAVRFTVKSEGGNATSPYQYGIMFEDINNSGDGGVYAELIQNRAFQGDVSVASIAAVSIQAASQSCVGYMLTLRPSAHIPEKLGLLVSDRRSFIVLEQPDRPSI